MSTLAHALRLPFSGTWLARNSPARRVLAPAAGRVMSVHDGEAGHVARRSQLARVPYALTQAARARGGAGAIAGNHVILDLEERGGYVVLAPPARRFGPGG